MGYHSHEAGLLPDNDELDELSIPDAILENAHVDFDQMRHEFDQVFESQAIVDDEMPEVIARSNEEMTHHFLRI